MGKLTPLELEMKRQLCSNYELASFIGVSYKTVSRWVCGNTEPTAAHKKQIAQYLGIKPCKLWPNLWDMEDLEKQYEVLKHRLMCYHYKAPRFASLCSQLAVISVKLYIRTIKRKKKEEGPDPYILPQSMHESLSC